MDTRHSHMVPFPMKTRGFTAMRRRHTRAKPGAPRRHRATGRGRTFHDASLRQTLEDDRSKSSGSSRRTGRTQPWPVRPRPALPGGWALPHRVGGAGAGGRGCQSRSPCSAPYSESRSSATPNLEVASADYNNPTQTRTVEPPQLVHFERKLVQISENPRINAELRPIRADSPSMCRYLPMCVNENRRPYHEIPHAHVGTYTSTASQLYYYF